MQKNKAISKKQAQELLTTEPKANHTLSSHLREAEIPPIPGDTVESLIRNKLSELYKLRESGRLHLNAIENQIFVLEAIQKQAQTLQGQPPDEPQQQETPHNGQGTPLESGKV